MDRVEIAENTGLTLAQIVRREVVLYQAHSHISTFYAMLDDENRRYGIFVVENDRSLEVPVWIFMMARVEDEYIIIEQDTSLNKHLYEALMVNGGIPREKIILAYMGEKLPDGSSAKV
jgi:hypothetical protein